MLNSRTPHRFSHRILFVSSFQSSSRDKLRHSLRNTCFSSTKPPMPPKKAAPKMAKRKASPPISPPTTAKKAKTTPSAIPSAIASAIASTIASTVPSATPSDPLRTPHPSASEAETHGIVDRAFYPPEMSTARAQAYINDELPRPIEELQSAQEETLTARQNIPVKGAVVHWFKTDLRTKDNAALSRASEMAREAGVPLVGLYIVSPEDFEAHLMAPVRVDFLLRSLEVLKADLARLDIPLWVETVQGRRAVPRKVMGLVGEWGASHLFANAEYEVDELRREARMIRRCSEKGVVMEVVHDTCVVPPGKLQSGTGKQYAVYTPWFRAWIVHVQSNPELLELFDAPSPNQPTAREHFAKLFDCTIPAAPENKKLSDEEKKRFGALWPAGEHEAQERLKKFAAQRISKYRENRNFPAETGTSSLSVHFTNGTLSARTAVRVARDANSSKKLDAGNPGIMTWISEIAWRDFYKHVLVHWPFVCMNKPFKPEYANITWEYDTPNFTAWSTGHTGYPLVDAAMRQLLATGWMHNRCRMVVASFLAKHLLLDWRLGEQFFMLHLVDGDFASNNGGWGWSASTGVDPQPYFRIFNPLLQSERFDPDGEYIRTWVPELKGVKGKAIHEPYERGEGKAAQKAGYPKKVVEHKMARDRALVRFKEGLAKGAE